MATRIKFEGLCIYILARLAGGKTVRALSLNSRFICAIPTSWGCLLGIVALAKPHLAQTGETPVGKAASR